MGDYGDMRVETESLVLACKRDVGLLMLGSD